MTPHNASLAAGAEAWGSSAQGAGGSAAPHPSLAHLVSFFRPHVEELARMGEQGLISPLPEAYRQRYLSA